MWSDIIFAALVALQSGMAAGVALCAWRPATPQQNRHAAALMATLAMFVLTLGLVLRGIASWGT